MKNQIPKENRFHGNGPTFLVAIDFSHGSRLALRKAKSLLGQELGRIVALHVIDHDFVEQCIKTNLGTESKIKKNLFLQAKARLIEFLLKEGMDEDGVETVTCEGTPCIEINKMAVKKDAEMIIMGSQGKSGDMKTIFFGSTTERVLRFITRPVLCIPPETEYKMG